MINAGGGATTTCFSSFCFASWKGAAARTRSPGFTGAPVNGIPGTSFWTRLFGTILPRKTFRPPSDWRRAPVTRSPPGSSGPVWSAGSKYVGQPPESPRTAGSTAHILIIIPFPSIQICVLFPRIIQDLNRTQVNNDVDNIPRRQDQENDEKILKIQS